MPHIAGRLAEEHVRLFVAGSVVVWTLLSPLLIAAMVALGLGMVGGALALSKAPTTATGASPRRTRPAESPSPTPGRLAFAHARSRPAGRHARAARRRPARRSADVVVPVRRYGFHVDFRTYGLGPAPPQAPSVDT